MIPLVLVRHGESLWNKEDLFTGWTDIDLSPKGIDEAHEAAKVLAKEGYVFDMAFTSVLKRAIRTLWIILDDMDLMWIPVHRSWRLNERHYGALQGKHKVATRDKVGEEQFTKWRRSYDIPPPPLTEDDERWSGRDPRYAHLTRDELPAAECLKDNLIRFLPYWQIVIAPEIRAGKRLLIAAHGNSLRALVKNLDHMSDEEIVSFNIPTGIPLVYELDDDLQPLRHYYLGDPEAIKRATDAVAKQGKK